MSTGMLALVNLAAAFLRCSLALFRSRNRQAIVELALRQRLAAYAHRKSKPELAPLDRAFWVVLFRLWPRWKEVLAIVKPDTVGRGAEHEPHESSELRSEERLGQCVDAAPQSIVDAGFSRGDTERASSWSRNLPIPWAGMVPSRGSRDAQQPP